MTYATIKLEHDGALAILTLNRPEKMNSLSDQLLADFRAAMDTCERDDNVRAMIVTGSGGLPSSAVAPRITQLAEYLLVEGKGKQLNRSVRPLACDVFPSEGPGTSNPERGSESPYAPNRTRRPSYLRRPERPDNTLAPCGKTARWGSRERIWMA